MIVVWQTPEGGSVIVHECRYKYLVIEVWTTLGGGSMIFHDFRHKYLVIVM